MMAGNSEPANDCFDWFCTPSPCDPARFSVAILAAHPDDEIIGVGARLAKLNRLVVVHVTDGAPRNMRDGYEAGFATPELYARVRRTEALAALSLGGLLPGQVIELGIPDQEAVWNLAEISRNAARVLHDLKTEIVVTHPYEGGHPDHDAVAFCVQAAATLLKQTSRNALGAVVEFTSYHARW